MTAFGKPLVLCKVWRDVTASVEELVLNCSGNALSSAYAEVLALRIGEIEVGEEGAADGRCRQNCL